jgi:hypothetical protein
MMPQKFGPWEDAVTRESYQKIIEIARKYRNGDTEDYIDGDDAMQAIEEVITDAEGYEVW